MTYDFIAIGSGAFKLGLACLAKPRVGRRLFLDSKAECSWRPGMRLDGSRLQKSSQANRPPMADPCTYPRNYKQQGLLYRHYIRENSYLSPQKSDLHCGLIKPSLDRDWPSGRLRSGLVRRNAYSCEAGTVLQDLPKPFQRINN